MALSSWDEWACGDAQIRFSLPGSRIFSVGGACRFQSLQAALDAGACGDIPEIPIPSSDLIAGIRAVLLATICQPQLDDWRENSDCMD